MDGLGLGADVQRRLEAAFALGRQKDVSRQRRKRYGPHQSPAPNRSRLETVEVACRHAPQPRREVDPQRYDVEATGEIETEDRVLVIKRIHVRYRLALPDERRAEADLVHSFHARFCPVARSLEGAIDISTELELV